jgi:hypothetical protein
MDNGGSGRLLVSKKASMSLAYAKLTKNIPSI